MLDTLQITKRLQAANLSAAQAEAIAESIAQVAGMELATKSDLHKELHSLTWRLVGLMGVQTVLILGAVYFLLSDLKADLREIRTRVSALSPQK
jgi:hypothetical protein